MRCLLLSCYLAAPEVPRPGFRCSGGFRVQGFRVWGRGAVEGLACRGEHVKLKIRVEI